MNRSGFDYSADHGFGMDIPTGPNEARYTEGYAEAQRQPYSPPSPEEPHQTTQTPAEFCFTEEGRDV